MAPTVTLPGGSVPSLAVLLCVHRDNPWLDEAIDSVLRQDDPDFEFWIAANACTDALWLRLQALAASDARIHLVRSDIGQLAFNLNLLADRTRCEYLVRMDADDICETHRLRALREALAREPLDVLGSAVILIDGQGKRIGKMRLPESAPDIERAMLTRTVFCHPAVALRREFLLKMRGYLGGFVSEDLDLWLRARRAGARMGNLPDALLRYRVHANQSIASRSGYAEVAAHWLRELLIAPGWYTLRGFVVALGKAVFAPLLPGVRRHRQTGQENTQ